MNFMDSSTILFLWEKIVIFLSGISLGLGLFMTVNSALNLFEDIAEGDLLIKRNLAEFIIAGILIKISLTF